MKASIQKTMAAFLWLTLFACSKPVTELPKVDVHGTRIFYNEIEYAKFQQKHRFEKVIIIDTACMSGKERALADIRANRLTYFAQAGFEMKEFARMLRKHKIKTKVYPYSCLRNGRFETSCYEQEMNGELERRFGTAFFDSIRRMARKAYIKKHPNEVYMEDGRDIRHVYQ